MKNGTDRLSRRCFKILLLVAMAEFAAADQASPDSRVHLNGKSFIVSVAATDETRQAGLSGSEPLTEGQGLLFIFDHDGYHPMWMKDMHFSLDIIWIDRAGTVVHIERGISSDTYPRIFFSHKSARYVLEISAGGSEGVASGTRVRFENIPRQH